MIRQRRRATTQGGGIWGRTPTRTGLGSGPAVAPLRAIFVGPIFNPRSATVKACQRVLPIIVRKIAVSGQFLFVT